MSTRVPITAAIIARNEAANLRELLPRLDWVDEIVLVDGGSQDGTAAVARAHGCRVFRRRLDTFAAQRNFALERATGPWVLSIDADERPTPRLVREIRRRVAEGRRAAFHVPIRSTIFGRPFRRSGTQDDRPVRLFRRDAARWQGHVHEVLCVRGRVGRLDSWLEHRTIPDLAAFWAKVDRYTGLEAAARVEAGQKPGKLEPWLGPPREVFRRLIWKGGLLDGPQGWAFCVLSGASEWVLARRHRELWAEMARLQGSRSSVPSFRARLAGAGSGFPIP